MAQLHLGKIQNRQKAFVTIVSVLVLGTMGVLVITTNLSMNTDNILSIAAIEKSKQAKLLAESCVEVAVDKLKNNVSYGGNETIITSFGSCSIGLIAGSGFTNRSFEATSNYQDFAYKFNVVIDQVNPTTIISSWQETL